MPSEPWVNGLKLSAHSVQRPGRPEAQLRPEIREVIGDGKEFEVDLGVYTGLFLEVRDR